MILRREIIDFSNIFVQCKKERVLRFFDPYCDVTKTILEPPVHKLRCVQQTRFFSYHKIINFDMEIFQQTACWTFWKLEKQ